MRKTISILLAAVMVFSLMCGLAGCNRQIFDATYKFDTAIISLPDGSVINGKVDSWLDFEDGDQIQVVIDGVTYLVHSNNVALIKD